METLHPAQSEGCLTAPAFLAAYFTEQENQQVRCIAMMYNLALVCLMSYTQSMYSMQQSLAIPYKLSLHLIYNLHNIKQTAVGS